MATLPQTPAGVLFAVGLAATLTAVGMQAAGMAALTTTGTNAAGTVAAGQGPPGPLAEGQEQPSADTYGRAGILSYPHSRHGSAQDGSRSNAASSSGKAFTGYWNAQRVAPDPKTKRDTLEDEARIPLSRWQATSARARAWLDKFWKPLFVSAINPRLLVFNNPVLLAASVFTLTWTLVS